MKLIPRWRWIVWNIKKWIWCKWFHPRWERCYPDVGGLGLKGVWHCTRCSPCWPFIDFHDPTKCGKTEYEDICKCGCEATMQCNKIGCPHERS